MDAELIAEDGLLNGLVLAFDQGSEWIVGRDPAACYLVLEDPKVARTHFVIRLIKGQYEIENLADKHPLLINNEPITEPYVLEAGDRVTVGDTLFVFYPEGGPVGFEAEIQGDKLREHEELDFGIEEEFDPEAIDLYEDELRKPFPPAEDEVAREGTKSGESELPEEASTDSEMQEDDLEEDMVLDEEVSSHSSEEKTQKLPEEELLEDEFPQEELVEKELVAEDEPQEQPEGEEALQEELTQEENIGADEAVASPPFPMAQDKPIDENKPSQFNEEFEEPALFNPDEVQMHDLSVDLTPSVRFLLKVIAGPNTGAEFALEPGKEYLIGTDTATCDIVFHDLSVSREHAKLIISSGGAATIEDLKSRNGVLVDQEKIEGSVPLHPNAVATIGTSSFFLIDKEAPQETIVTPIFDVPEQPTVVEEVEEGEEVAPQPEPALAVEREIPVKESKGGAIIFSFIVIGLVILLGLGTFSLFQSKEIEPVPKNFMAEIREAMVEFPAVKYTFNPTTKRLFLVGHVASGVEKNELVYNLQGLTFLQGVDDNVVDDESVWQEMNLLLSKHPQFKGVTMHSPRPGVFVLSGYLKTDKQASDLTDYINLHFNYINLLENRVVVEQQILDEISSRLMQQGFGAVLVTFLQGELTLAGYVGSTHTYEFEKLMSEFREIPGIRQVQDYVVIVAPEEQVIDLNQRYPGRYKVTGYSKHGDVNINVVINGHILTRGDMIDQMTVTSIQPHTIFFEKDGLKYKLEYNK